MQIDFKKYIAESKKTYNFKVGLAGMLADDTGDRLESAMQKFSVVNMSNGKKTPIQKKALDFPFQEFLQRKALALTHHEPYKPTHDETSYPS